jgi:Ran GTPase-activating protein (RanGAP) involved in mRNA processing and transport
MQQNKVRDEGAVEFARMLKSNKTLKTLNLRANYIGREGYEMLGGALHKDINTTLEKCLMEFNQIPEDDGASA